LRQPVIIYKIITDPSRGSKPTGSLVYYATRLEAFRAYVPSEELM